MNLQPSGYGGGYASTKRHKSGYPCGYYIKGKGVPNSGHKFQRIYYITYRKNGKQIQEKAGHQYKDNMTATRATNMRAKRVEGKELSNAERREVDEVAKRMREMHREKNSDSLEHLTGLYKSELKHKGEDGGGPTFGVHRRQST